VIVIRRPQDAEAHLADAVMCCPHWGARSIFVFIDTDGFIVIFSDGQHTSRTHGLEND